MKKIIGMVLIGILISGTVVFGNILSNNTTTNKIFADRVTYASIQDLKKASDIVIVATVNKQLETYNLNRLAGEQKDAMVILGTDYEVNVEKYLKGNGDTKLIVIQEGGELNGQIQDMEGRTPMELGKRYVFFLNKNPDNNKYMFGGDPYKFKLVNGKASVDSDSDRIKNKFKEKDEKKLIEEIETAK